MWDAWLGFETTQQDRDEETIENGDSKHSPEQYRTKLSGGIAEMFKVLKYGRWMSIVFAHRDVAMWDTIISAAQEAGFEYVNTVPQPLNVVWSMHKKKNPLTVLSGELIINFRKVSNPKTLAISSAGIGAVNLIKNSAELTIVHNGGATLDQIYNELIPKLLENGMLGQVSSEIGDITDILNDEFTFDKESKTYLVKTGSKLGCHIPMNQRIHFYLIDYLNQAERQAIKVTFDDIWLHVMPKLKNGQQPRKQSILNELKKVARPIEGKWWTRDLSPSLFEGDPEFPSAPAAEVPPKAEKDYEHNEILVMLAGLGQAAGFGCYIGKKEQAESWDGYLLSQLSIKTLPFLKGQDPYTVSKVEQIDLMWLDSKRPALSFEIEHSTPINTALDRFLELLKLDNKSAERMVIVAPSSRKKKLDDVLKKSHYIGAPMYFDTKVRYLWYSDVIRIAEKFAGQHPTQLMLAETITAALREPKS